MRVKSSVKPFLFFLAVLITINTLIVQANGFIYTNATNNADTYLSQEQANISFGASGYLGVYGSRARMAAIMNWTLPSGSGDMTGITLNMYCNKWDSFPETPVELYALDEGFNESEAAWNNRKPLINRTIYGMPPPDGSTLLDDITVNKEGIYTWVIKRKGVKGGLDSLTWNQSITLALVLPNETGWSGIQCYSRENPVTYYRPYIVVTNERVSTPSIANITTYKAGKTSALIISNSDVAALTRINYGTNISSLDKWSEYDTAMDGSSHNLLSSLSPDTTYYYSFNIYNYIDTNIHYSMNSSDFMFTTRENTAAEPIPLITFVFDDGLKTTYTRAFPILNNFSFPGVTAAISSAASGNSSRYMNWIELQMLQNVYNWEIASHTVTHPDLKSLDNARLDYELNESKNALRSHGLDVYNFVSPYGSYNTRTEARIMKYYDSDRSTSSLFIPPDSDYPLAAKNIWNTTTLDEAKSWVDEAVTNNSWLIFVFHNIGDYMGQDAGEWTEGEWTTDNLTGLAAYIESKGKLRVVTIREAQTMQFDYRGIYSSTATKDLTNTIHPDGSIDYSKTVTGHKRVNMVILPSSDYINTTILNWSSDGGYHKIWNESSMNTSVSAYHLIGDFPADTPVLIKKNGKDWKTFTSNASGFITFVYGGGYDNLQFEAAALQLQPTLRPAPQTSGGLSEMAAVVAILAISGLFLIIRRNKQKP